MHFGKKSINKFGLRTIIVRKSLKGVLWNITSIMDLCQNSESVNLYKFTYIRIKRCGKVVKEIDLYNDVVKPNWTLRMRQGWRHAKNNHLKIKKTKYVDVQIFQMMSIPKMSI